jgi:AcrR family transcriptional regulator
MTISYSAHMEAAARAVAGPNAREVRRAGRPVGRPPRVDRRAVVAAALEIANDEGIEALSLRAVAERLDVTPAALYRLVDGAPDLLRIVIQSVLEEAVSGVVVPADWRAALEQFAGLLHASLLRHPLFVEAYQSSFVDSPSVHRLVDELLQRLASTGLEDEVVIDTFAAVHAFAVGYAALEHRRRDLVPSDYEAFDDASAAPDAARLRRLIATRYYAPEGFELGLARLLDGVAASLPKGRRR